MRSYSHVRHLVVVALLITTLFAAGCGSTPAPTATPVPPTAAPTQAPPTAAPTKAAPTATVVPPTATPQGPKVGGTWTMGLVTEPPVLDPHKSYELLGPNSYMGAAPLALDGKTGQYVPYLAQSWKVSDDGLTWEFKLKPGIKFHDGTPLTAQDYAWTFTRLIDPETKSPMVGSFLSSLAGAEAVDDSTFRLTLKQPYFPMIFVMTIPAFTQPLERAQVEKAGDKFGQPGGVPPVGVGPYKFKEWKAGASITLERNADFKWGPDLLGGGPWIQTLVFRYIPEVATLSAGLQTGEIDDISGVPSNMIEQVKASGLFQVLASVSGGCNPAGLMNHSQPPFNDLKVRQAFSLAIDRQALIKVVALGYATEQRGPVSPSTIGYWPGIEQIGYGTDLAKAKSLMKDAGYVAGADGMLTKDGKPFTLDLLSWTSPQFVQTAQVLQQNLKDLGVTINIKQQESATYISDLLAGKFQFALLSYGYPEFDTVVTVFGSNAIGGMDFAKANDPKLDAALLATRTSVDQTKHQQACTDAQKYMVEHAVMIPMMAMQQFEVVSNRIKYPVDPATSMLALVAAYLTK